VSSRTRPFIARTTFFVVCGIVPFALASCGSDSDSSSDATSAPAASAAGSDAAPAGGGATLVISGFAFGEVSGATAGSTISITNDDGANHTVTADDGSFSVDVPASGTAELTAPAAGTYPYHCTIHVSMKGTLTVT
jgi:plastocyanin